MKTDWESVGFTDGHRCPTTMTGFSVEEGCFYFELEQEGIENMVVLEFNNAAPLDTLISTLQNARDEAFGERYTKTAVGSQKMSIEVSVDFVPNVSALEELVASLKALHKEE